MKRSNDGSQEMVEGMKKTKKLHDEECKDNESGEVQEPGNISVENAQEQILEWGKTAAVPERLGFLKLFLECIPTDSLKHVTSLAARSHALRMKDIETRNSQISGGAAEANDHGQGEGSGAGTGSSPKKRKIETKETESNDEEEEEWEEEELEEEEAEEEEEEFRGKIVFDYGHAHITPPPTIEFPTDEEDTVASQRDQIVNRPVSIPVSSMLSLPIQIFSGARIRGNFSPTIGHLRGNRDRVPRFSHNQGPQHGHGGRGNEFNVPPERYY